jgi:hypothetical protein
MIACTFLLGLANDGHEKNTKSGAYLQQTMEITSTADANDIIKKIKARGRSRGSAIKIVQKKICSKCHF